jgi:hypothetical protein
LRRRRKGGLEILLLVSARAEKNFTHLAAKALSILHTHLLFTPDLLNCSIPAEYNRLATAVCLIVLGKIYTTSTLRSTHLPRIPEAKSSWLRKNPPLPSCSTRPRLTLLRQPRRRKRTAEKMVNTLAADRRRQAVTPSDTVSIDKLHRTRAEISPAPLYGLERAGAFTAQPSFHTQPLCLFLLRNQHESNISHSLRAVTFQQGLCNG